MKVCVLASGSAGNAIYVQEGRTRVLIDAGLTGRQVEARLGIATDLGVVTRLVHQRLRGADLVVMEANHDRDLLMNGPYPWDLKRRIGGNRGHLSNGKAAEALCDLAEEGLRQAFLAHLSDENNRPDLAEGTCRSELKGRGVGDFSLAVVGQERPSPIFVI